MHSPTLASASSLKHRSNLPCFAVRKCFFVKLDSRREFFCWAKERRCQSWPWVAFGSERLIKMFSVASTAPGVCLTSDLRQRYTSDTRCFLLIRAIFRDKDWCCRNHKFNSVAVFCGRGCVCGFCRSQDRLICVLTKSYCEGYKNTIRPCSCDSIDKKVTRHYSKYEKVKCWPFANTSTRFTHEITC